MLALLRPALASIGLFTLLLGLAYPLAITSVAQAAFPHQADGSLLIRDGRVVGSSLVGQGFTSARYLQGRPSAGRGLQPWPPERRPHRRDVDPRRDLAGLDRKRQRPRRRGHRLGLRAGSPHLSSQRPGPGRTHRHRARR
jgi:hypothetical protein